MSIVKANANGRRDVYRQAIDVERLCHFVEYMLGHGLRLYVGMDARQHDDEFIAAKSAGDIFFSDTAEQTPSNFLQYFVADFMAI